MEITFSPLRSASKTKGLEDITDGMQWQTRRELLCKFNTTSSTF